MGKGAKDVRGSSAAVVVAIASMIVVVATAGATLAQPTSVEPLPAEESVATDYHWDRSRPRPFVSARLDGGAVLRTQMHVGYGRPFWMWAGLEGHVMTTSEFGAVYAGARFVLPVLEFTAGVRWNRAYRRGALPSLPTYGDSVLEAHQGPFTYRAIDLDLYGLVPVGRCLFPIEVGLTHALDTVPRYEEWHRFVVTGRTAVVTRIGALVTLGRKRRHSLGVLAEYLRDTPDRRLFFRLGPAYSWRYSPRLDLYVVFTTPVVSPDSLGLWNGLYGTATIRYRLASGDRPRLD